jgi:hypothetical protein
MQHSILKIAYHLMQVLQFFQSVYLIRQNSTYSVENQDVLSHHLLLLKGQGLEVFATRMRTRSMQ